MTIGQNWQHASILSNNAVPNTVYANLSELFVRKASVIFGIYFYFFETLLAALDYVLYITERVVINLFDNLIGANFVRFTKYKRDRYQHLIWRMIKCKNFHFVISNWKSVALKIQ